jgi:AbrB family looped-hinge helix DNA binding protein
MSTAILTSKGQITIPAAVRASMHLDKGSRVAFVESGKGQFLMVAATSPVQNLKGLLRKPNAPVSIEQMNQIIASRGANK